MKKLLTFLIMVFFLVSCGGQVYKITFETNGGTNIEPLAIKHGYHVTTIEIPTKDNFNFVGWYLDEGLTNHFDIVGTPIVEDLTLYAKWENIEEF